MRAHDHVDECALLDKLRRCIRSSIHTALVIDAVRASIGAPTPLELLQAPSFRMFFRSMEVVWPYLLSAALALPDALRWRPIHLPEILGYIATALRKSLMFALFCGCAFGDVAAMGASLLLALGLHASTAASCSAFTMLVMLSLDARFFSLDTKMVLCVVSALAPLFPPEQGSAAAKATAHTPLIVDAPELQEPEAPTYGGEIVCDKPPPPKAPATGHKANVTTTATGQVIEQCETVSLPGLNIQWPFSQLILSGVKTVEVRSYALGCRNIARPGVEMWLVETPGDAKAISKGWVHQSDSVVAPQPKHAQIVGTVTFSAVEGGEVAST